MERITILMGHYGSGKTEIAVEKALMSAQNGRKTTLVDLDVINPYFRSGEQAGVLEEAGVSVVMPVFEGYNVDVPSLPPQVNRIFADQESRFILDAGGETGGAAVVGSFARQLAQEDAAAYAVVNTLRPWCDTVAHIAGMIDKLTSRSRLPIAGIIHNTSLARQTTPEQVVAGQRLAEEAGAALGIPVVEIYAQPAILAALPEDFQAAYAAELRPLHLRMRPDWLDETL